MTARHMTSTNHALCVGRVRNGVIEVIDLRENGPAGTRANAPESREAGRLEGDESKITPTPRETDRKSIPADAVPVVARVMIEQYRALRAHGAPRHTARHLARRTRHAATMGAIEGRLYAVAKLGVRHG
jgi:hypothetical protein